MKIAVFLPNWVGDAVMATPALRALRNHFGGANIIGVLKPYVAGILEGAPWLDRLIFLDANGPWSQRWPAVAWQLRKEKIDLAILLPNSFHSALVAWLSRCRRRIGYDRYQRGFLLTDRLRPLRDDRGRIKPSPIIHAYNILAEAAGCPAPSLHMELFTMPRDEAAADAVWRQTGLNGQREIVCLNPGAAFGSAKHWPTEHFVRLAQDLADRRGSGVLILCGPSERSLARQIAVNARRPSVHSLADYPLSLGLTKACIRRSALLITTDSGPRHFAAAFQRPVVTLFGPTHIAWTETFYAHAIHLQKKVPCGPCQLRVCPLDHRCMKDLGPAEVFAAAIRLLDRSSSLAV
jgi:lipopolysaccharide heptosyltransferase II